MFVCERARGRENELSKGQRHLSVRTGRKKDICKRCSTPAERKMRGRVEERETVIMFSGSPLVQLLMDLVKR